MIRVGTSGGLFENEAVVAFEGRSITALVRNGAASWAIVEGVEVWREEGGSWALAASAEGPRLNCLLPVPSGVLVGTAEAHLLRLGDGHLEPVRSFDEVDGSETWYTPWGGPPDTRSLSLGPDGVLYANVHVGGIPRSTDSGETWQPTIEIDTDVHRVFADHDEPGVVVAALGAGGMAVSRNAGETWDLQTNGLDQTYCRAIAIAGVTVILTASDGPRGGRAAVYRRALVADTFERCGGELPEWFDGNIDSHCLDARGLRVAFGTPDGDIYQSEDEGRTWILAATGLPTIACVLIVD